MKEGVDIEKTLGCKQILAYVLIYARQGSTYP